MGGIIIGLCSQGMSFFQNKFWLSRVSAKAYIDIDFILVS